jgi:D-3-phosphoglycerate dehydrogenase
MAKKIVIADHREEGFHLEERAFTDAGAEVFICECSNENELIEAAKDANILIFTSSKLNSNVLGNLPECRMIIRYGIGLDNVDINAASRNGIYVCNAPSYGTFAVAEHTFALLLCLNRKLLQLDQNVKNHIWGIDSVVPVRSLWKKTLGIVGFGNIGRHVCTMAHAFNMKVLVYDPYVNIEILKSYDALPVDFNRLISDSDHITIHVPLNSDTKHLLCKNVFSRMKPEATLINTGRGSLVNQEDLTEALIAGTIAGAGLDVFEDEPVPSDSRLLSLSNLVLSPHVAWYTEESIVNLHQEVVDEVLRFLNGDLPLNIVNRELLQI